MPFGLGSQQWVYVSHLAKRETAVCLALARTSRYTFHLRATRARQSEVIVMLRPKRLAQLTCGLSLSLLTPALFGCADNDSSLFIRGVMVPSSECAFEPSASSALWTRGVLDVSFSDVYFAGLLIGNQLLPRGDPNKLRTETARILVRGAVVSVNTATGQTLAEYTTNATGFADPARGDTPGWGVSVVAITPAGLLTRSGVANNESWSELNIAVSIFGDTLGGDEIESNTLTFPVFVCDGCLLDCSTVREGTDQCLITQDVPNSCFPGQDEPTPCQYSRDLAAGDEPCQG